MITVGLTGPSGAGKGAVGEILKQHGFVVIDSDEVYHKIISKPGDCVTELANTFGVDILNEDGSLNRAALAKIVFEKGNDHKLKALNEITHKYVVREIRGMIVSLRCAMPSACVIDAPLLFEAGLEEDCAFTIAVLANIDTRAKRIAIRDRITHEQAMTRISAQKTDDFYISQSDYVIYNDGDYAALHGRVNDILRDRRML